MSTSYETFRSKTISLLDLLFFTYVALLVVVIPFYLTVLPRNIQNSTPLVLIIFLATFTWIIRSKINSSASEHIQEIKQVLIQWLVLSLFFTVFTLLVVIVYPES